MMSVCEAVKTNQAPAPPPAMLSAPVPRYTSYPTAPHFHGKIGEGHYRNWLRRLDPDAGVSVYAHIPYCDRLCWFCGCHTKQTKRYDPVAVYIGVLQREIDLLREAVGFAPRLCQLHLGGGSPSMLLDADLERLRATFERNFRFSADAQVSLELDPSDKTAEEFASLARFGITRASIGVQDFDDRVQRAINRPQTYAQTAAAVEALRNLDVTSINIDALYGLPYQSCKTIEKTIKQVIALAPDRIALFGYAHVPWMKKHQSLIPDEALPDGTERLAQAKVASDLLAASGYVSIGIDHFARPGDGLAVAAAQGRLRRNFQGYTDDHCTTLLGLGASSIGKLAEGYFQNEVATGQYMRSVADGVLPVVRGIALTAEDRLFGDVIEHIMCNFQFSLSALRMRHGPMVQRLVNRIRHVVQEDQFGLSEFDGDVFRVSKNARAYTRIVASWFDARLNASAARYSTAV